MNFRKILRSAYLSGRGLLLAPFVGRGWDVAADLKDAGRILVFTMDRLGDLMCTLPTLSALRKAAPRAEITVCSPAYIKDLLLAHPDIDRWRDFQDLRADQGGERFDISIDLSTDHPLARDLYARRSGIKVRIGYNIAGRGAFLTHSLPCRRDGVHAVDVLARLLTVLGIDEIDRRPRLAVKDEWRRELHGALEEASWNGREFAAIHPGGTYETQRWPAARFAAVGDRLAGVMPGPPVLLGGPAESELCREIVGLMSIKPVNLCGALSLRGLTAAIAEARLLVCNNSGPLHMAVAVDTPTVSNMGPTLPDTWWPIGDKHTVIRHDLPCSPCNEGVCPIKTHECLMSISVDEMWAAVSNSLSTKSR